MEGSPRAPAGTARHRALAAVVVVGGLAAFVASTREAPDGPDQRAIEEAPQAPLPTEAPEEAKAARAERSPAQPATAEDEGPHESESRSKHLTDHQISTRTAGSRRSASRNHQPADILLNHAEDALETGDHQRALDLARQAQHSRKSPLAYSIEAQALCHQGDGARAQRAYERIIGPLRETTKTACNKANISLR